MVTINEEDDGHLIIIKGSSSKKSLKIFQNFYDKSQPLSSTQYSIRIIMVQILTPTIAGNALLALVMIWIIILYAAVNIDFEKRTDGGKKSNI